MEPNGVILKSNDFKIQGEKVYINPTKIKSVPGMLLIFGNFCGHCHRFMPTFNEIANKMGNAYTCASIESEDIKGQDALIKALDFQGYPTICFFNQNGLIMTQYEGSRDKKSILDEICNTYHHCVRNYK